MIRRVVGLTTSYPLHPDSCAGVFVRSLYRNLPTDWTVEVICPDDDRSICHADSDNLSIHRVRYAPRRWQQLAQQSGGIVSGIRSAPLRIVLIPILLMALTLRSARVSRRADLIHANWVLCGVIAVLVGRLRRVPVVMTLRGDDVTRASRSKLERWLLKFAVRGSRTVICVSSAMAEQMKALFPQRAADIHVCLNGVDDAFFDVARPSSSLPDVNVAAVGSLIPRKGYETLIDAVGTMRHAEYVRVKIVGEGPLRAALLRRMSEKAVNNRFELVGELPPKDIPAFLAKADVFVLSSLAEGRPNAVVEALASGLPVISSRLPGVEGLVVDGQNGWLTDASDALALASALDQAVIDKDERCKRGIAARKMLRDLGQTWKDTGKRYAQLFDAALLAKKGAVKG